MKRVFIIFLLCLFIGAAGCSAAQSLSLEEMNAAEEAESWQETPEQPQTISARDEMIDRILATAKALYDDAGGRAKRAHYSGDIP